MKLTYPARLKISITFSWNLIDTLFKKHTSAIDDAQITNKNLSNIIYSWNKIITKMPYNNLLLMKLSWCLFPVISYFHYFSDIFIPISNLIILKSFFYPIYQLNFHIISITNNIFCLICFIHRVLRILTKIFPMQKG